MDEYEVVDNRGSTPVFIHSELDDLGLTPEAFRVYCHLVRRAGKGKAYPRQQSIGDICFPRVQRRDSEHKRLDKATSPHSARYMAMKAIEALEDHGLIIQKKRRREDGFKTSSLYELTPPSNWIAWEDLPERGSQGDLNQGSQGDLNQGSQGDLNQGSQGDLNQGSQGDQHKGIPLNSFKGTPQIEGTPPEPDKYLKNEISKTLEIKIEEPTQEESIEGEILSSDSEPHQSVSEQKSKSRSDRSGASAAQNPVRGALEKAFECKSSSDPDFARFRRVYQGVLAIGDGNSSFGNMRDAQMAWQDLVDEGAIDDLFWRGVDAYLVQQGQLRMRGEKNFPPGAAKFLETRAWEVALLRSKQQAAAKDAGLPDVGATAAERKNAEFKANMAEAMRILQERYAC